jgi:Putative lumazine-binding
MKALAPVIALSLFLLVHSSAKAQTKSADDSSAVRDTVTNYMEAYYTGDTLRMQQTLHPHYLKHMIHGDIPMREKTGAEMVKEVRAHGPADLPAEQKTEQVSVLDIAGNLASAKLVTPGWTDYMTLSKVDGQWKILSVVQRIDN